MVVIDDQLTVWRPSPAALTKIQQILAEDTDSLDCLTCEEHSINDALEAAKCYID